MRYKLLLILILSTGCIPTDKIETDYKKGWIIEKNGKRHFYGDEVVIGKEIRCLIHRVDEVVYLKKNLDSLHEIK
tara:strand:+ start:1376 stop:1600 length:225 start_codon:yes stop_codon:yes gene_type:complete